MPKLSFGVLWCVLWSGKYGKSIGIIAAINAVGLWDARQRPEILIADQGRALSKEKGQGFVADVWIENDGIKLDRRDAHVLWQAQNHNITHIWSKKEAAKSRNCDPDELIVSQHDIDILGPCLVLQKQDFMITAPHISCGRGKGT